MSRKPRKGYFVRGQFVAEGSELDQEFKRELHGDTPSKTVLKAQSSELQALGEQLLELRADLLDGLHLPDRLLDALHELARLRNFEGRRRQSQYLGKLMRQLDDAQIEAIQAALQAQRQPSAQATMLLHAAEDWRERLLASDDAASAWIEQHPATDIQQLRALVRQARKDAPPAAEQRQAEARGQAQRHGRAYRELYRLLHEQLQAADEAGTPPASD